MLYNLDEITLIPSKISSIKSRSECDGAYYYTGVKTYPLFVSPMACLVDDTNADILKGYGLNVIVPRTVPWGIRMDRMVKNEWVAVGLKEAKHLYYTWSRVLASGFELEDFTPHLCIDQANGHMEELLDLCANFKRLLGNDAPFSSGIMFIIMGIMMICGFVYGYTSGNIKNSTEYSVALSKSFEGLGYVFVLLFFVSQMVGILEYSNLGPVIATNIISFISSLTVSGIPIIIMFFIAIILISILIPSTEAKWNLVAPLSIPLLMRANVTPSFSQFVFRVADGIGKSFTPFFVYYIIMLAFLEKYNTKENTKITVFGILKTILPTLLLFTALWLVIILCWYLLGVHTGPGVYSTF